jgi:hypothetical protein
VRLDKEAAHSVNQTEQKRREDKYVDERMFRVGRKMIAVRRQKLCVPQELSVKGDCAG